MNRSGARIPIVVGALLGAVVFVVTAVLSIPFVAGDRAELLVAVLVALVLGAATACTTWFPALALGIAWAGALLQMAYRLPVLPSDVAILGVLFAAAASPSTRLRWLGLGSAVLGGLVATAYLVFPAWVSRPGGALVPFIVVLFAATGVLVLAWTFGLLLALLRRGQAARAEALAAQREAIEEQERGRIARDMHDVVAHSLAVIVAQADGARYLAASEPARATDALETVSGIARGALGDVRVLLARLRHQQGDLPQPGAAELVSLVRQVREAGLDVTFDEAEVPGGLPSAIELAMYRIVQESLTNALRHGDVDRPVRVTIERVATERAGAAIRLEVRSAMRAETPAGAPGHGLVGMRERARLVGGEFASLVDAGEFVATATLPAGEGRIA